MPGHELATIPVFGGPAFSLDGCLDSRAPTAGTIRLTLYIYPSGVKRFVLDYAARDEVEPAFW
jgi:hypothetical protein